MTDDTALFNLIDFDAQVCPIDASPGSAIWQDPEALASGRAALAALTGRFLPPDNANPPNTRGTTVISGGDGTPIEVRDKTGRAANLDFGRDGEQEAAFIYGQRGYSLALGPSGAGGKATNARGFDMLPFRAVAGELELTINDNKQSTGGAPTAKCTALNENLVQNLADTIQQVSGLNPFPEQGAIVAKLSATKSAFENRGQLPAGVGLYITNGGGNVTGISNSLDADFVARYKGVRDSDGNQVRLRFDSMRPPATLQQAAAQTQAAAAEITEVAPYEPLAAPMTATPMMPIEHTGATTGEAVVSAGQALPIILDIIDTGLRLVGVKDATERSVDDRLKDLLKNQVAPHLLRSPEDGALIEIPVVTTVTPNFDAPVSEVSGYRVSYGTSAAEAYIRYLDVATIGVQPTLYTSVQRRLYWYHGGELKPYFPAQDPALRPAK